VTTLDLNEARLIVCAAFEYGEANSLKLPAVAVVDAGGHLTAFERQDGTSNMRSQITFGKALGALALGMDSRTIMEGAESQPYFTAAVTAAIGGSLIPMPGGLLLRGGDGLVVGAGGISGDISDSDELAARAGAQRAGLCWDQAECQCSTLRLRLRGGSIPAR
jgi:uncharacterized protein GlcG (DUF336 family)